MLLFVSWRNKYAIFEWPLFDAPTSTHGVFTSFSLSRCLCLPFCRNKFRLMWAQGYFKGQRSGIIHKLQLFYDFVWYAIIKLQLLDAPSSTHGVLISFSLSKCYCLHFWRNKFGLKRKMVGFRMLILVVKSTSVILLRIFFFFTNNN